MATMFACVSPNGILSTANLILGAEFVKYIYLFCKVKSVRGVSLNTLSDLT